VNESAGQGKRGDASGGIVLGPDEGHTIPGTDAMTLKATGEQTAGSIGFLEATSSPGYGPPRHIHRSHDELFYVLEGEFRFLVGERLVSAPPGSFVFVPRGTVHAAKVVGTEPARCWWPTCREAWSAPSRSSPGCAPSRERMRTGAGPWRR
jgi:quercetin dioxygenase-like cupin family protein